MLRRLLRRWRLGAPRARERDPIRSFDALVVDLERQAATFRAGAATLLSLRTGLRAQWEEARHAIEDVEARLVEARRLPDGAALVRALTSDLESLTARRSTRAELFARADTDAALLLEGARALQEELTRLRSERQEAIDTLTLDRTMRDTLRARVERVEAHLALDAARDEVARAHALAEIYRDEAGSSGTATEGSFSGTVRRLPEPPSSRS